MKEILVLCNHTTLDEIPTRIEFDEQIQINAIPPNQNLRLQIENITHQILSNLNPISKDLLEIASYIYYADCSIKRGSDRDVFAKDWKRKFNFVIPVNNPDLWNNQTINNLLKDTIEFLSGDEFSFTFLPPRPTPTQLYFDFPDKPQPFHGADCISLFSGGLDSLVGSLYFLKDLNKRSVLLSHRSRPNLDRRQKNLVRALNERNPEWSFPHLSVWINRKGNRAVENTQRTRSFLYLSLAASIASELDIKKILISENGIVSLNLPISGQNIGTLLTRSTHPKFLNQFEELARRIFNNNEINIENPFVFKTKTQMLQMLENWNQSELIQEAISCSYSQGRTLYQPQCGVCFQCVNRRFSVISAGLEEHDRVDFYDKDIFLHELSEGMERIIPLEYVRTAIELNRMDENAFFKKFVELDEVISYIDMPSSECAEKIFELFKRHSYEVTGVLNARYNEHSSEYLSGNLPDNCLISMTGRLDHLLNPIDEYAEKIWRILSISLPSIFQSEKPSSERRLQEAGKGVLDGAGERLHRESPTLSYSLVGTTPDFSNVPDFENLLFIEFKFLNTRPRLNQVITEITSRITIYRDQGAYVLFVVYDANRFISNDEEFIADFERHEKIKVKILR